MRAASPAAADPTGGPRMTVPRALYLCELCEPHDGDRVYLPDEMWWSDSQRTWLCRDCWIEWSAGGPLREAVRLDAFLGGAALAELAERLEASTEALADERSCMHAAATLADGTYMDAGSERRIRELDGLIGANRAVIARAKGEVPA